MEAFRQEDYAAFKKGVIDPWTKTWVITEADGSSMCLPLPEEYPRLNGAIQRRPGS
jgi:hypothetical protein